MALKDLVPWGDRKQGGIASPFESFRALVEPMERLLSAPWAVIGTPETDIHESPKEIVVSAKMPGFKRDEIHVDVTETTVTIEARQGSSDEQRRKHGIVRKQEQKQFKSRLVLPAPVKTSEARATFKDDRLELHLPRVKEAQVRRIDIT